MTKQTTTIAAAAALAIGLTAAGNAQAYESGDFLVQLLATGFYSAASGHVADQTNFDSGDVTANPALDLTYFVNKNISVATVLAVPNAKVDLHGGGKTEQATDQWVLPLSLIGQYHFFSDEMISPYIGAGPTYAWFWEGKSHLGSHVEVDDTYGGLINVGVNVKIPDTRWVAVVDVKKWFLAPTDMHLGGNKLSGNLSVDPWLFGVGVGYNFSTPAIF